jgi:hypothetical protein
MAKAQSLTLGLAREKILARMRSGSIGCRVWIGIATQFVHSDCTFPKFEKSIVVVTPLKWDVCLTPESRHRSATLPIAMSSSCYGAAKLADKHLASKVHCVDDEIIWVVGAA